MNTGVKIIIGLLIVIVLAGVIWLSYRNTDTAEAGPITIGFIAPLTGDAAAIGTVARAATELAVEEINKSGGIQGRQLNVIYEDGQCLAQTANSAATKLINVDNAVAIIGGICSSETSAFAPNAMQSKVIVISECSSAPNLSSTGKYFFRNYPSDAYQGKFAAEYAYNTLGARKVAVIFHQTDWGIGIKDVFIKRFKELGGEIVTEEGSAQESRDYRTQLTKLKAANPEYIYAPTYPEGGTVLLRQMKELGISVKVLAGDAWSDTKLHADVKNLGLDILYTESKGYVSDEFKTKLLERTGGEQVSLCAPQAYDATYILANALKTAGTDPEKLADAMRETSYNGVSGHIEFDENGDMTVADYVVKRIAGGTATQVQ